MNEQENLLIPKWEIGDKLSYKVTKKETFRYKESYTKPFTRNYEIEIRRIQERVFEAYYIHSVFSSFKLINIPQETFIKINDSKRNTVFYEAEEDFSFVKIKNFIELKENLLLLLEEIKTILNLDDYEDVIENMELIIENDEKLEEYLTEDIQNIHLGYGSEVEDGMFYDLSNESSTLKKISRKLLGLVNLNLGAVNFLQKDFLNEEEYQLEFLRAKNTIGGRKKLDFPLIEDLFVKNNFDLKEFENISADHRCIKFSTRNNFMINHLYAMTIKTPTMLKSVEKEYVLK